MNEPKEVRELNKRLGDSLGRNPFGEPLYMWFHSESWFHWMRDISGYREVKKPSGIYAMEPIYVERKMCPNMNDMWVVGHWHDPGDENSWNKNYGSDALFPRRGYYTPSSACQVPGQLPTQTQTDDLIWMVRKQRAKTQADVYQEGVDAVEAKERSNDSKRKDIIGDAMTAFMSVPGKRGGHVSFPSVGEDRREVAANQI
jgi:hypothetical protein